MKFLKFVLKRLKPTGKVDFKKTLKKAGRAGLEAGVISLVAAMNNPEMMAAAPWIPVAVFSLRIVLDYIKHNNTTK